ncbi:NADP-dependent oxidoreductase domain-containing protein [Mycena leptocephala]|nr:NADP-dependent oxidoreductase domain-containing protein [Mycena leptocephala]
MSQTEYPPFDPKGMPFRRLGPSGLRVSLLSLGGSQDLMLGESFTGDAAKASRTEPSRPVTLVQTAFENGINTFDTAETYADGKSELELGRVIKELGYKRTDLVIMTKIFWGIRDGPNDSGLSRKHIIEGTQECLERLQMTYVDVIFGHRYDRTVPMEEIVRAFNHVIEKGWASYWGTSAWPAQQIEEAHHIATKLTLIPPISEQMLHNMFYRERPEKEYASLYEKYGYGTTIWSPLSGEYSRKGSRFSTESRRAALTSPEGVAEISKVKELTKIAQTLDSTPTALALAWLAKNPNTSTIILGVSSAEQLLENLEALKVLPKITDEHLAQIEEILGNKPEAFPTYSRPALDVYGRH